MKKSRKINIKNLKKEIDQIKWTIASLELICPGTLQKRMKCCGKKNCRCTTDPEGRHGPYYEWTRREKGKFKNSLLSESQAELMDNAIGNYQKVLRLLALWGEKSALIMLHKKENK